MDRAFLLFTLLTLIKLCISYTLWYAILQTLMLYTLEGVHLCVQHLLKGGLLSETQAKGYPMKLKICASCGENKPIKDFNRRLTIAQSRAILNNPKINTPYISTSKNCSECRLQSKRRTPLSIQEVKNKMATGDIRQQLGESLVKQKREAIPRRRSKVMKEYWQKKRTGWVDTLKANLQTQVTAYANRYYSYQNQMPEQPTDRQHAMLEQHRYNYAEAKRIRQDLLEQAKAGREFSPDTQINELIKRRKVGVA